MRLGQWAAVLALGAGLTVVGAGVVGLVLTHHAETARPVALAAVPAPAGPVAGVPVRAKHVARPVQLIIPVIGVRTKLIELGLTAAGALQVPSSTSVAGWYTGSSRPGAVGPAVIAGHIDSYTGPGVFFRLVRLNTGDKIYIRRADGTVVLFRVISVQTYAKDQFPTREVYGPTPDAELRLITCGGAFDPSRHAYLSNVVVFAVQSAKG